jgi:hypothetical protein
MFTLLHDVSGDLKRSMSASVLKGCSSAVMSARTESSPSKGLTKLLSTVGSDKKTLGKKLVKEEISFARMIIESSSTILEDLMESTVRFDPEKNTDLLEDVKKSFFNWRNNPENNEKQLRKEFKTLDNEWIVENRNLIGVSQGKDWLSNLNIGTVMHMTPLSYHDMLTTSDTLLHLTKDYILEKVAPTIALLLQVRCVDYISIHSILHPVNRDEIPV